MAVNLETLNRKYNDLSPEERIAELYIDFPDDRVLMTSSFGTTSVFLLNLYQRVNPNQPVHFINTGYHFKETIRYKEELKRSMNLNVIDVLPEPNESEFTRRDETWSKDPDLCCQLNKVKPIEKIKANFDVWVSGLTRYQNDFRRKLSVFEQNGILRFYPLIDVPKEDMEEYISRHSLPVNPLKFQGYESVGCTHCTFKGSSRNGRWLGMEKTECGLHT